MNAPKPQSPPEPSEPPARERLDSWKEISTYLKRDESTVRRWEQEGLPVHRHTHKKKATVYGYRSEIDIWWNQDRVRLEQPQEKEAGSQPRRLGWWVAAGLILLFMVLGLNVTRVRDRLLGRPVAGEITSIGVLPLENLSGDQKQDYFADGMTDALITELGKIGALRVISRQSVMQYQHTRKPLEQIAGELKVDALVEGAVVRENGRVSVTAQLVQTHPERHIWAARYERDLTSVLELQREVARTIAGEIRAKLTPQEKAGLFKAYPVNPRAYEAYLRGQFFMEKVTQEGIAKGIEYQRQAIEIDPSYAPAYVGAADGYNRAAIHGYMPAKEAYAEAKATVSRGLQLDENSAEGHTLMGVIKFRFDWDWAGAERELKLALQLSPSSSRAHLGYSTYLLAMGRTDDAIRVAQRNVELDPLTPQRHINLAWELAYASRHEEAIAELRKALELTPDSALAYGLLAKNHAATGRFSEAVRECERALDLPLDSTIWRICGEAYILAGKRQRALKLLKKLLNQSPAAPYQVALLCDALGDDKQAMQWLVRAYEERVAEMCLLKTEAFSARLRSNPRFQNLLNQMNFPQ